MGSKRDSKLVETLIDKATVDGILYFRNWITAAIGAGAEAMLLRSRAAVSRISDSVQLSPSSELDLRDVALRCIVRKNHETYEAILTLVEKGQSYAAMSLLRSMCEELIFARFLVDLPLQDANEYLFHKSNYELGESLRAQHEFFSQLRSRDLAAYRDGNPRNVRERTLREAIDQQKHTLKEIGKRLGWGKRLAPTVEYMADRGGCLDVYHFYYHAASNSVHANLHTLLRLVWGDVSSGEYSIAGANFEAYYRRVVLVYGAILLDEILRVATSYFPQMWEEGEEREYRKSAENVTKYPPELITEEELRVPHPRTP